MPTKTSEKTVNDHAYQVVPFGAMTGLRYAIQLARIVGPAVGKAADGVGAEGAEMSFDELLATDISIGDVVTALVENLEEEATLRLISGLFRSCHRDGHDMSDEFKFNEAYSTNYGELFGALRFILEVNYGGFFSAWSVGRTGGHTGDGQGNKELSRVN